jgi:hypothetical protein
MKRLFAAAPVTTNTTTMKNATPFFSDFFNTDCLVVEGEPHFSITGATKTLYGTKGGSSAESLRKHLLKTATPQTPVTASDLSEFPGILPVLIDNGHMKQEATAMTQDTFKALLRVYRGKDTKAGRYAEEMTDKLVGISMDLLLRKEAGLVHEEVAKAIDASILRSCHDEAKAYKGALGQLQLECYRSYYGKPKATEVPFPHTRQFGRWFASVLNEGIYSRVHAGVLKEVNHLKEKSGGTTWQYLTEDVRTALMPTIMLLINNVRRDGWYNMDLIIKGLDEFYPRFDQGYKRPRFN